MFIDVIHLITGIKVVGLNCKSAFVCTWITSKNDPKPVHTFV